MPFPFKFPLPAIYWVLLNTANGFAPPFGYAFLVDRNNNFYVDRNGNFYITKII